MKYAGIYFFTYALIFIMIMAACKNNDTGHNKALTFYYYPKTNAYYDLSNASFIYSVDSGKNWTVLLDSTRKNAAQLGKKIVLTSTSTDIWRDNEIHRKMYGGTLMNFVNARHDTAKAMASLPTPKPIVKKKLMINPADSLIKTDVPHKKRNFFQRLFGKKKKKKKADENQPVNT